MSKWFRQYAAEHPLRILLGLGMALRLIAAIFARGYMATDDHNQVIELAAQWLRGENDYLAGDRQFYRSLLYPYLNYVQIAGCHALGIVHPNGVMFINRLLHAVFALWTIALTYRIGSHLAGKQEAFIAGLIVAAHALMPYVAVRNLIESVSTPFLLWGLNSILTARDVVRVRLLPDGQAEITHPERAHPVRVTRWIIAGFAFGVAVLIRWQVGSAIVGVIGYLLVKRRWNEVFLIGIGSLLPILTEGIWDYQTHGVFLGSLWRYIEHNAAHAYDYVVGPWYRYLLLILGVFVPPFSLLCCYASGRYIQRLGILAWAVLSFLVVHSVVPGKQERFLLPIFPLLVLMFVIALWHWEKEHSARWRQWVGYGWRWFWVVDAIMLIGALTHYGQRGKIEPLIGLFDQADATGVLVDVTERGRRTDLPLFYLDGGGTRALPEVFQATKPTEIDSLLSVGPRDHWNYAVVFSRGQFEAHMSMLRQRFGEVEIIRHTGPTLVEQALLLLNPSHTHSRESWLCRLKPN